MTSPSREASRKGVIRAELAENLARSYQSEPGPAEPEEGAAESAAYQRPVEGPLRIKVPYRSTFNRAVRLIGMACLLGSSLGVLAAAGGLPVNFLGMLAALLVSLALIGWSARPSLRRPRF